MILKRTVRDEITKNIYESSNVLASTYNKKDKDLVVVFKNGGQYLYTGVEERDYMRFETADSQGKVLNSHIKKYPFTKIGDADVEKINEELHNDKMLTLYNITTKMIPIIEDIKELHNDEALVDVKKIYLLGEIIDEFKLVNDN